MTGRPAAALAAAALLLATGGLALAPASAPAASGTPTPSASSSSPSTGPTVMFRLKSHSVPSSSGLARSVRHPGIWYTVNGAGHSATVYAFNSSGRLVTELTFVASVKDVEAIAVTRDAKILVADCGDPNTSRTRFTVYELDEPASLTSQKLSYHAYDFAYPDGAHDAQSMLVQPGTGRMYFATKASSGALYAAPTAPSRTGLNRLSKVVSTLPGQLTDGVFGADGGRIYLRTSSTAYAYSWPGFKQVGTEALPTTDKGTTLQGGTLALAGSSDHLLAGTAGAFSPVYEIPLPSAATASNPSSPATTPAASPSGSSTQAAADDPSLQSGETPATPWYRDAKVLTIAGAAVFAILVMLITVPIGRGERQDAAMEQLRRRPRRH